MVNWCAYFELFDFRPLDGQNQDLVKLELKKKQKIIFGQDFGQLFLLKNITSRLRFIHYEDFTFSVFGIILPITVHDTSIVIQKI